MGLFSKLKGVKEPKEGVAPIGREDLRQKLLALNHDQVPFSVAASHGGKEGDIVAQWKIVDAQWYEIFAKASLEKTHRIYIALDDKRSEARIL